MKEASNETIDLVCAFVGTIQALAIAQTADTKKRETSSVEQEILRLEVVGREATLKNDAVVLISC
ncbi:MAG: hypothetical protein ACR2H6_14950 [Pyrinomonadaceae bacterium]